MTNDFAADGTTTIATYSNRHDAEMAKGYLAKQNIDSLIVADDVHPPFQLTEGVKLQVLNSVANRAREVLASKEVSSTREPIGPEAQPEPTENEPVENLTFSLGGLVETTAWTYIALFSVSVVLIVLGLLVTRLT